MAKLSKVDAAKAAGVSRQTLYTYLKDGRLSADADGLIDTAELLRAGFTLHLGHDTGRQDVNPIGQPLTSRFGVCPTFYTRSSSVIRGPCSINWAMWRERYLTA